MPTSLRLIKSRSHGRLIEAAKEFIASHPEVILVVPGHSAGEEMAHRMGRVAGLHRVTLIQIAADLARGAMSEAGMVPLTSLGLEAIATRVVQLARNENELHYFGPVAALPGFARALTRTLGELRLAGVDPDTLAESGAPGADLGRLLKRYEVELRDRHLADLATIFKLATLAASEGTHRWLGMPLVLLDVPVDSSCHQRLVAGLVSGAPAVLAATSDPSRDRSLTVAAQKVIPSRACQQAEDLLSEILGVQAEDLDGSPEDSALQRLRSYVFEPGPEPHSSASGLEVFSAPGEGLEAVEIARRILRLAHEGIAFDQVAILLRAPDRYQPMLEDALNRARIPAYFSRGTVRPDPGGRAFLALLACAAEKCSASRFAEYLSLGQLPHAGWIQTHEWVGADDEVLPPADGADESTEPQTDETSVPRAPSAWERLLVDAAVIGGRDRWQRRLAGLENEFELRLKSLERDDDPQRGYLVRQLDQLRELGRFALPLIEALDALPASALWREWIGQLGNLARIALRRPEPVLAVLAEFEPMADVGPATLEEVAEVLRDRMSFLRREPPARRYGRVLVGSIEEARAREFAIVFLPGLAEGLFPQRAFEDPLLLDRFRRAVDENLALRDDRAGDERLRLRLAIGAARDRIVASFPRMDVAEARARVPSFYALELPRAVEGALPELREFERMAREAAPARLNWPAPRETADAIDDAEYDLVMLGEALKNGRGARYVLEANPHLARSLRARWRRWASKWAEPDGLITKDPSALAALAEHRLAARPWSPSALQQFAVCPYKFALHGIYGLRPRDEAAPIEQMDPLTRGGLFHALQFALLGELRSCHLLPVNSVRLAEVLQIADRVLDEVTPNYEEKLAPAIPRVWTNEIEDLRTDLRGWLQHIALNDDDWEPIHFEFAFGLPASAGRDPASTTEEAKLAECNIRLRGSIDLVERHITRDGVLRITDHKTGKLPETIPAYTGGGRFLQPLLYGLAAEKLLGANVESGRLFYSTQQGGYQHAVIPLTPKARQFLARLLENIDQSIADGFLPPAPQKDACEVCDYRIVCGPYEELRLARHKDRRDERLDLVTEIRAML